MANDTIDVQSEEEREEAYRRQLAEAKKNQSSGVMGSLGSGKIGKAARTGALALGLMGRARPHAEEDTIQKAQEDALLGNQQTSSQTLSEPLDEMQQRQYKESGAMQFADPTKEGSAAGSGFASAAQKGTKAVGKTAELAGKGVSYAGAGAEYLGKGGQELSKGLKKGGATMMRTGATMSETGAGAILGVPLAIAGGAATVAGEGGEIASKGLEVGGKGAKRVGKEITRTGGNISSFAQKIPGGGAMGEVAKSELEAGETAKEVGEALVNPQKLTQLAFKRELQQAKQAALEAATGDVSGAINTVINTATGAYLKWCWFLTLPLFGLPLIYIAFHFVARYVYGSERFCKFGDEWGVKVPMLGIDQAAKSVSGLRGGLELAEIAGMFVLLGLFGAAYIAISGVWNLVLCAASDPTQLFSGVPTCF